MAAALGETKKNMMRPIERGRHWFLMRGCMSEEQGFGGRPFHEGGCSEKGNALTSTKGYKVRRQVIWGSVKEMRSCRDRGRWSGS